LVHLLIINPGKKPPFSMLFADIWNDSLGWGSTLRKADLSARQENIAGLFPGFQWDSNSQYKRRSYEIHRPCGHPARLCVMFWAVLLSLLIRSFFVCCVSSSALYLYGRHSVVVAIKQIIFVYSNKTQVYL